MITLEDIRAHATALPEVEEKLHFGRPAFRVRDRLFVSVHLEPDVASVILHVDEARAAAAADDDPDTYEQVWREHGGRQIFVGLRVDLAEVPAERFRSLLEDAWRHRAPKRLVAQTEEGRA
jgi:hypothetical protein